MPKELSHYAGKESVHRNADGNPCRIIRAIDVADACTLRQQGGPVRLEYVTDRNGLTVVINDCYPGPAYGNHQAFGLVALGDRPRPPAFDALAGVIGIAPDALLQLVQDHAPQIEASASAQA